VCNTAGSAVQWVSGDAFDVRWAPGSQILINGFPYGAFHGTVVKADVYAPDWRDEARVRYTLDLVEVLRGLLPEGLDGGISTSPLSYKPWLPEPSPADWETMTHNVARVAERLVRVRREQGRFIGTNDNYHARRFRHREVEMRAGHRVHRAEDRTEFVRPSGVINQPVNRARDLAARFGASRAALDLGPQFAFAPLQHFRRPIQNLAPQIRALLRPARERAPRRCHRIAKIFPGRAAVIRSGFSIVARRRQDSAALAAHELSADKQLVGLLNPETRSVFSHELRIAH
jgi:hypothetical protein